MKILHSIPLLLCQCGASPLPFVSSLSFSPPSCPDLVCFYCCAVAFSVGRYAEVKRTCDWSEAQVKETHQALTLKVRKKNKSVDAKQ
jgi:hypothetical protein